MINNIAKSTIKLELKVIGEITLLKPKINNKLKMLDPITLPITKSTSPFRTALTEVTNSGREVPIETIVKPTNVSDIPNAKASDLALSTTKSPPKTIAAIPTTIKTIAIGKL